MSEPITVLTTADVECWPTFPVDPPADGLAGTEPKPGVHQWSQAEVYEIDPLTRERGQVLYRDAPECMECGLALAEETVGTQCAGRLDVP